MFNLKYINSFFKYYLQIYFYWIYKFILNPINGNTSPLNIEFAMRKILFHGEKCIDETIWIHLTASSFLFILKRNEIYITILLTFACSFSALQTILSQAKYLIIYINAYCNSIFDCRLNIWSWFQPLTPLIQMFNCFGTWVAYICII